MIPQKIRLMKIGYPLTLLLLLGPAILAEQHEIRFPISEGAVMAPPGWIGFMYEGRIGFAYGLDGPPNAVTNKLYSFSLSPATVLDEYNLSRELGSGVHSLRFADCARLGLIAISSSVENEQKLTLLRLDRLGHFSKLWATTLTTSGVGIPSSVFNDDGTKLYAFHRDSLSRLAMLDTGNGTVLATVALPDQDDQAHLLFDSVAKRPIMGTFEYIHVFAPEAQGFQMEWSGEVSDGYHGMASVTVSEDGRFLFGYVSSSIYLDPAKTTNDFMALDLQSKKLYLSSFESKIAPAANCLSFDPHNRTIFVPYSVKVKVKKNGFTIVGSGSNLMDIMELSANGDITQAAKVEVPPENSESNSRPISPFNNVALSQSGALGFVSSLKNKRIFSFDTSTGEIVNEISVPDELSYIYRPGDLDVLVYANGTNKLVVVDIATAPIVTDVQVKRGRTIIKGANFLFGARVQINGEDLGIVDRNPDAPGHEIIINRGKKDFPSGQDINIVVINRDGLRSNTFIFRR